MMNLKSQISTLKSQYKEIMKLKCFNLEKRYNKAKSEQQELRRRRQPNQQLKKTIKDASKRAWHLLMKKAEGRVMENAKFVTLKKEMSGCT
ncbi:hypothetical protein P1U20_26625 [Escherichia coli]